MAGIPGSSRVAGCITKVVFSPDGGRVAALAQNWQAAIWNTEGRSIRVLDVRPGSLAGNAGLGFSPDGHSVCVFRGPRSQALGLGKRGETASWVLPRGVCDLPVFRGPDRRCFVASRPRMAGVRSVTKYHPREYPRVCVIRNLLGPNTAQATRRDR